MRRGVLVALAAGTLALTGCSTNERPDSNLPQEVRESIASKDATSACVANMVGYDNSELASLNANTIAKTDFEAYIGAMTESTSKDLTIKLIESKCPERADAARAWLDEHF